MLRRGLGLAMGIYKGGTGREGEAEVRITPDGRVQLAVGGVDVGQGSTTILAQIAAEALGVPVDRIDVVMADTDRTPPAHVTAGSSTTITTGAAVKLAAEEAKRQLLALVDGIPQAFDPGVAPIRRDDIVGTARVTSGSNAYLTNAFAAHFAEVEVDMRNGRIRVLRYVAAHDSGRIVHPRLAENQVSGGVLQFLGIALREELYLDKHRGVTLNANFLEHKSTSIVDFPPIEVLFPAGPDPVGPYGAKALGEPPVVPVLAAVANAVANATGVWLRDVPFTPQRVLQAIACARKGRAVRPFAFVEPTSLDEVIRLLAAGQDQTRLIAGGSDLLGELKDDVVAYERLVSLAGVEELRHIREEGGGLRLGALVTVAQLEYDPRLDGPYRILAEAARSVATPEIRAQGTLGGNLCQRPRCLYYRHALTPCLKKGGADCPALDSPYQAYLSIMGGQGCYSVHASDLAPPLMALGAQVSIAGLSGVRTLAAEQFFAGPEQDVRRENVLAADEVLTAVTYQPRRPGWQGTYLKARERTAGDFPVVSVAVGYALDAGRHTPGASGAGGRRPCPLA